MERRNTVQKEIVFNTVCKLANHATADEIYEAVSAEYPTISRGTVYRNLNSLAEEGRILKVEVPSEAAHYDHFCKDHYHIHCVRCGKVFDVDMDPLPYLCNKIKDAHGFDFLGYDIAFKGICPTCGNTESAGEQL